MVRSVEMVIGDRAIHRRRPDAYSLPVDRRIDFFFFLLSTLFANIRTGGEGRGEEGLFLLCPANEKLENNPRVAGEIFNSILCSNFGSLTERSYKRGDLCRGIQ